MDLNTQDVNPDISSTSVTTQAPDVTPPSSSGSDVTPPSSSGSDVSAPSSGADAPAEKQDLLSVVMDAVKQPKTEDDSPPAKAAEATPTGATGGEAGSDNADPAEVSPEELASFTPAAQKRIRELANTNRELRSQLADVQAVVEDHGKLTSFMQENHLQHEHVGTLLQFGALLRKGDLAQAKAIMEPYWLAVTEALGERLPPDVQQQVDDGLLAEEVARELVRTRSERDRLKNTVVETTRAVEADTTEQVRVNISRAVKDWEAQIRARDPDYSDKADTVQEFAKAIIAERGRPRSPQEAQAYAQEAYEKVQKTFAKFRPAVTPTRPSPVGGHVATPVAAEPKSLLEAVQLGLQRSRTG